VSNLAGIKNNSKKSSFKCNHCGKSFVKESTLLVHVCEKKRRFLARKEKHVQMGLMTYQKFYEVTQNSKKQKTFEEFIKSQYYTAFVKFGSFMVNTLPIYPERFIEHVVRSGIKIDRWCRDEIYETYITELIKIEPADGAIQRAIKTMIDWADSNDAQWEHYFKYVQSNRLTHDIKEGLISPWLLFNCKSGKAALTSLNDEQLNIISPVINPKFWMTRFKVLPADTELIKTIVKEANIP